jgi:hypothetical protein
LILSRNYYIKIIFAKKNKPFNHLKNILTEKKKLKFGVKKKETAKRDEC